QARGGHRAPGRSPAAEEQRTRAAWSARPLPHPPGASASCDGLRRYGNRGRVSTSIADRQNLPEMSVAIFPVDVLPAETVIDQHVVLATRAAPVREPGGLNAAEDRVEVGIGDAEAEMVALELLAIGEVNGQRVVDVHRRELTPRFLPAH